jgi:hypothetical protein
MKLTLPRMLAVTAGVLGLMVIVGGIGTLAWYRSEGLLPLYLVADQGARLSLGNRVYAQELALEPLEGQLARAIGKTSDGLHIYGLKDDPQHAYVVLRGLMFPDVVYRDQTLRKWEMDWPTIEDIQLVETAGERRVVKTTQAADPIRELVATMSGLPQVHTARGGYRSYQLLLTSKALPGLGYSLYVIIDDSGQVFLAEKATPEQWIAAGPEFTQWLKDP